MTLIQIRVEWIDKDSCCRCKNYCYVHSGSDGHRYCDTCREELIKQDLAEYGGFQTTARHNCDDWQTPLEHSANWLENAHEASKQFFEKYHSVKDELLAVVQEYEQIHNKKLVRIEIMHDDRIGLNVKTVKLDFIYEENDEIKKPNIDVEWR